MKIFSGLISIILLTLLCSCSGGKEPSEAFVKYKQKFPVAKFPLKFRPSELDHEKIKRIDIADTAFTKDPLANYYVMLPDTSNFYCLVTLVSADDFFPVLTTFSKSGDLIDRKPIGVRGCGGGPCINFCSSTSIIEKNLSIFAVDSIYAGECDSISKPIPGTNTLTRMFWHGKIKADGKIEVGEEQFAEHLK